MSSPNPTSASVFSSSQLSFIATSNNVIVSLSLISLLIFSISVLRLPSADITFSLKLICNLFFADFLFTLTNILSNFSSESHLACSLEGFLKTYSLCSSVFWAYIIAFVAYNKTVSNSRTIQNRYNQFRLIAYGFPLIISLLPFIPTLPFWYGTNNVYCWIVGDNEDKTVIVRWAIFFCWVWIIILLTTALYVRLYLYLKRLNVNTRLLDYRTLLIYPVILYVALIPATLRDSGLFANNQFPIMVVHIILLHSIALYDCLAYGFQRMRAMARSNKQMNQESFAPAISTRRFDRNSNEMLEFGDGTQARSKSQEALSSDNSLNIMLKQMSL